RCLGRPWRSGSPATASIARAGIGVTAPPRRCPCIRSLMASPPGNSSAPVLIPGFEVLEPIGHGGFSVVYRARQVSMQREVAVKVLNTGFASEVGRRRFERECHALGRLSRHPNIVTVFSDAMTSDGRPAIVMELYESTLRDRLGESG